MEQASVYIIGGDMNVADVLKQDSRLKVINGGPVDPSLVDIMLFTGGADIYPDYYCEKPEFCTWFNRSRDHTEFKIFEMTKDTHYHVGICRGAQLLWVANGGKLWQDITGHSLSGSHNMITIDGNRIEGVTSVHHQCARVTPGFEQHVLAWENYEQPVLARSPDKKKGFKLDKVPEAIWFNDTRSFGVQGHPEFSPASPEYIEYFLYHMLDDKETGYFHNKGAK